MPISSTGLVVFMSMFIPITLLAVSARVWAIYLRRRQFCAHDYLVFAAECLSLALNGATIWPLAAGIDGRHITDVPDHQQQILKKSFTLSAYLWLFAASATKLSVLQLMLEIFGKAPRTKRAIIVIEILIALFTIAVLLAITLQCRPFAYNWDAHISGSCGDVKATVKLSAAANLALDVLIWLLPQPTVWNLQMDRRRKLNVSIIFGVGLLLCLVNLLRAITGTAPNGDFTYLMTNDNLYACLEVWLGVIVACLIVLQPVVERMWKCLKGVTTEFMSWKILPTLVENRSYSARTGDYDLPDLTAASIDNQAEFVSIGFPAATTTVDIEHGKLFNINLDNEIDGIGVRTDVDVNLTPKLTPT